MHKHISGIKSSFASLTGPERWKRAILRQWERAMPGEFPYLSSDEERAMPGEFPYLSSDEHMAYAKARVTAFRSDSEWLVIFEVLGYVAEAGKFWDTVYAYGNRVRQRTRSCSMGGCAVSGRVNATMIKRGSGLTPALVVILC